MAKKKVVKQDTNDFGIGSVVEYKSFTDEFNLADVTSAEVTAINTDGSVNLEMNGLDEKKMTKQSVTEGSGFNQYTNA